MFIADSDKGADPISPERHDHMSRRRGELTSGSRINREWPHQVALPADQLLGKMAIRIALMR
jgi:hypothetical protein